MKKTPVLKRQARPRENFKRAKPKLLPYPSHHEHQEHDRSSLKTLASMYARLHKNDSSNNQEIPAWSAFQKLSAKLLLNQVNVGYLSPIADSPTKMKVIYTAIYRSLDIMNELDIKFIFSEVIRQFTRKFSMLCLKRKQKDLKYSRNLSDVLVTSTLVFAW